MLGGQLAALRGAAALPRAQRSCPQGASLLGCHICMKGKQMQRGCRTSRRRCESRADCWPLPTTHCSGACCRMWTGQLTATSTVPLKQTRRVLRQARPTCCSTLQIVDAQAPGYMPGMAMEEALRADLSRKRVWFWSEDALRGLGEVKTPDVKLQVPIAVDGHTIYWLDSKATFGSPQLHRWARGD